MRVTIVKSGTNSDGSMHRVRIHHIGTLRAENLNKNVLTECPVLVTILASSQIEARKEAEKTCRKEKWTVIE